MHTITTQSLREIAAFDRTGMHRLRADVFASRLGWDVHVDPEGLEVDRFDELDQVHYILAKDSTERVNACWRLLPTLGPNMLRDQFPELLAPGDDAPAAADTWEISRFAVASERVVDRNGEYQLRFSELSVRLMAESTRFARANGIARYVAVTTTSIERLLKKQGVNIYRLGPPQQIGCVMSVACAIELDEITRRALHCD
jgi:acyl homoserine lactone synthase